MAVSVAKVHLVDATPGHTGISDQTFEPAPEAAISSHAGTGLDFTAPASGLASLIPTAAAPAHHGAIASAGAAPPESESGIWLKDGLPADAPDTDDPDFEELLSQDLPHEVLPHEVLPHGVLPDVDLPHEVFPHKGPPHENLRQETSPRDEAHRVITPAQLPGLLTPPEHKPPALDMLAHPFAEALPQPGEPAAPHRDPKIIRLRPLMVVPPAPVPVEARPLAASIANDHNPQALSTSEHHAFREIARKLGAQVADAPVADISPQNPPVPVEIRVPETAQSHAAPPSGDADAAHVLQRLPLGVLVSRNGEPLLINRMLLDMLGYSSAHAFSLSQGMERMFKGRAPESLDPSPEGGAVPIVALDGEVIMAEARMQSIDWSGQPATLITLRRAADSDNGARLRSLEMDLRLREAETRELHAILDTATDGVVVLDDSGRILSLNRSAEALFGYDQNEVAGENFTTLIARDSQAAATGYLEGIRGNGVATVLNDGREIFARARQGGAIPIFMTLGRVGSGATPKFCAVLRDLTQWKKAERELSDARLQAEHASALKSDFLAKISHEIRTPLNAILGFAEVMIEERFGAIGNDRYKDYLKDIHGSGKHVMSLVNDLLDLSKIEAGKMELEFSSVDANKIVAECVSLMQPEAARERVVMRQSLAPRLPNVVADERALRQIVLNLLSNAVKFNETGGQVIISTALTDAGHAVIRIRDTGIGMSEEDVQVALEPFRQLQTARKHSGTGLGLPLTKALVEANRASFSIKSKKNEGTLVEVAFPPTRVLAE